MQKTRNGRKVAACFDMEDNLSVLSIPSGVEDRFTLHEIQDVAESPCRKVKSADGRQKEWIPIGERRSGKWEQQLDDVESKRICQALCRDIKKSRSRDAVYICAAARKGKKSHWCEKRQCQGSQMTSPPGLIRRKQNMRMSGNHSSAVGFSSRP